MTVRIVYSKDDENFNTDCAGDIINDIIRDGFDIEVGDKITYYEAFARDFVPSDFVTNHRISSFLEDMNCSACDEAGDYAEDFGYCDDEAKEELRNLIGAWADKHLTCSFWGIESSKPVEVLITREMLD